MFIPINPWGHYKINNEIHGISSLNFSAKAFFIVYFILNIVLYFLAFSLPQHWNCRYVTIGMSVFITFMGVIELIFEIRDYLNDKKKNKTNKK